jgi:HEAT repeat protein
VLDNALLAVLAIEIGALGALLFGVLLVNRVWRQHRADQAAGAATHLDALLRAWLAGGTVEAVATGLAGLPPGAAVEQLLRIAASRLTPETRAALGARLRDERWVRRTLRGERSWWWWRRLEAVRLLAIVGAPADAPVVRRRLRDPHLAVRAAASQCLAVCGAELAASVVERLPEQPETLQRQQGEALRDHAWQAAERAVLVHLGAPAVPDAARVAWLRLARTLGTPAALQAAMQAGRDAAAHPVAAVRREAVLAAGQLFDPAALAAVTAACTDPDAGVRAAAGRAAAGFGLAGRRLVPLLDVLLGDSVWEVRHRAALALAQLGEPGREALRRARTSADVRARDMAVAVSGLTDGALMEYAST